MKLSILPIVILLLLSPLFYYGFSIIKAKSKMQEVAVPEDIPANRYLYSGSWPASHDSNVLIQNFDKFKIKEAFKAKPLNSSNAK